MHEVLPCGAPGCNPLRTEGAKPSRFLLGDLANHPQSATQAAWTSNVLLFSMLTSLACRAMERRYAKQLAFNS